MCSSSLTALHLACESLQLGRCDVAIAGGVNVSVHPNKYLMLGQGKFLSSKGRCESFGEGGDGYVPSEGVGAVLLKRLEHARADGDHIYGVIRGTAINHGGKTNGYTVPNPNAQASVIERAMEEAGVHPRTISYLEAHGTGTSLGDPIEIAGLNRAFLKHTEDKQFCSIGSVKSNIGHCESAAGIGGLTKVLLQMQHGRLVPSLHANPLNEAIDFEASPFVVQQHLDDWRRPEITIDGERKEYPRIAGVSSFGAGGSNAHVIVEEYVAAEPSRDDHNLRRENLIVLSARTEERLSVVVQNLYDFLRESCDSGRSLDFTSLAYTLQVGREAMRERLAIAAASTEEAQDRLHRWLCGEVAGNGIYRGGSKESRDMLSLLVSDGDMQDTVTRWLEERKCEKLAALWVSGLSIDWTRMYEDPKPFRMSLPTYPFEKERYWVPETAGLAASEIHTGRAIHPLLHENTSTFSEQRFTTTFTGKEPFLADHRVQGQSVLPGVAYLEMVRAGMEQASQIRADEAVVTMRNVVWSQPVTVNGSPVSIHLGLSADDGGRIGYQVYGEPPSASGDDRVVYSRGEVLLRSWTEPPRLDVPDLLSRCDRVSFGPADCYALYSDLGIEYGPAHRGIERIHVGDEELLAKLKLPSTSSGGNDTYILHPGMLDSALQPAIYAGVTDGSLLRPSLPFALDEVEIFGPSMPEMWAYTRLSAGNGPGGKVRKLDIDICDEDGKVCARLRGLSSRELTTVASKARSFAVSARKDSKEGVGTFLLTPVWDSLAVDGNDFFPGPASAMVVVGGNSSLEDAVRMRYADTRSLELKTDDTIDRIAERIRALPALDHVLWIAPATPVSGVTDEALITAQEEGVLLGFRLIKALLREGFGSKSLGMTVITTNSQTIGTDEDVNPAHASIHGLIGSLAKEYPAWRVRLLDMEADGEWPIAEIFGVPADPQGNATVYRQGEWYKQQLIQFVPEITEI
jgi:polyketide synthase PksM